MVFPRAWAIDPTDFRNKSGRHKWTASSSVHESLYTF
jgi:hypothetical protein